MNDLMRGGGRITYCAIKLHRVNLLSFDPNTGFMHISKIKNRRSEVWLRMDDGWISQMLRPSLALMNTEGFVANKNWSILHAEAGLHRNGKFNKNSQLIKNKNSLLGWIKSFCACHKFYQFWVNPRMILKIGISLFLQ